MKFDSLYEAPSESWKIRKVCGSIQKDSRIKLAKRMNRVNSKIVITRKTKHKTRIQQEDSSDEELQEIRKDLDTNISSES